MQYYHTMYVLKHVRFEISRCSVIIVFCDSNLFNFLLLLYFTFIYNINYLFV